MPQPGYFVLHKWANPPLKAGAYRLHAEHTIGGHAAAPLDSHITVTSPRYLLPPDQLLGVYPPTNAGGEFVRLPQIVLKRRTLPYERDPAPDPAPPHHSLHPDHPWLALVVLHADECTLLPSVPVAEAVSDDVTHTGERDVDRCTCVELPSSVVEKVFPTIDELPLLTHLREVDQRDTELAMGDDDGWLAVVLANRLPVVDTDEHGDLKPVRYLACLVNLEGQFHHLPPPTPPVHVFDGLVFMALDAQAMTAEAPVTDIDHMVAKQTATTPLMSALPSSAAAPTGAANVAMDWQAHATFVETGALTEVADPGAWVRKAMGEEFIGPIGPVFDLDPRLRFPVLAYWTFTTIGAGGFDTYMQELDVGLLGTPPPPAAEPAARPPLETVETGHVGLAHLTRRGDRTRAWYRGPFVPRPVDRGGADAAGHFPLAHVSDQLRVMTPDGREDLSRAAAFEIGRLLALSRPSIVASLLRWRREQFGARRAAELARSVFGAELVDERLVGPDLGRLVTHRMLDALGDRPEEVFAPARPFVDPGRPLLLTEPGEEFALVARGLGVQLGELVDVDAVALSSLLLELAGGEVPTADVDAVPDSTDLSRLHDAVTARVDQLAQDVVGGREKAARGEPDELEGVLGRIDRRQP